MSPPVRKPRSSLFVRIYVTFVVTMLGFAVVAGAAVWIFASTYGAAWVESVTDSIDESGPALIQQLPEAALGTSPAVRQLAEELDAEVHVFPVPPYLKHNPELRKAMHHRGHKAHMPDLSKRERKRLRRGFPIVRRRGFGKAPMVAWRITNDDGKAAALVVIEPHARPGARLGIGLVLLLAMLAVGAWPLARWISSRVQTLERSTRRLAEGDLDHRAPLRSDIPRDEIDALGHAFNHMADRIASLLNGQRTLLANVSHELRTPLARMRVLLEILDERVERLDAADPTVARLRKGLTEMGEDVMEVEGLIQDLLTSGRLELGKSIQLAPLELCPLLDKAAGRVEAKVLCDPPDLEIDGDELLLQRLLSNLLANARRACPEGRIVISAYRSEGRVVVDVEDEGAGIAPEQRETVFEPFTRLDAARDRDRGGVGLGLYLCRQIARAHGGDLQAQSRHDGKPGARLELTLPPAGVHSSTPRPRSQSSSAARSTS